MNACTAVINKSHKILLFASLSVQQKLYYFFKVLLKM